MSAELPWWVVWLLLFNNVDWICLLSFDCAFVVVWVLLWFMLGSVCGWVLMWLGCCGYLWVAAYGDWRLWLFDCALYLIVLIRFLVFVMVFCLWI